MRYLVKARLKAGAGKPLLDAIKSGDLGRGSVAGSEYKENMRFARLGSDGVAYWVETCFCDVPLQEERPYWERYFDLLSVKDAHSRRNCKHETGTELWACSDCDCTRRLENRLEQTGVSFLQRLLAQSSS